jgi:hypothetical protein
VHVRATNAAAMEPPAAAAAGVGGCDRAGLVPPVGARGGGGEAAREPGAEASAGRKGRGEAVPLRMRLARARRRAGPGTPAPSWKMGDDEAASSSVARRSSASASARQLGASLWEIHDVAPEARRGLASAALEGAGSVGESGQVRVARALFFPPSACRRTEWISADSVSW